MKLRTAVRLLLSGEYLLALRILRTSNAFYRACFVSTALSEGLLQKLKDGPVGLGQLCEELGSESGRDGLEAWLDLGVSLGELGRGPDGYRIRGALSRRLARCGNDTYEALLREIVELHYGCVLHTPSLLRQEKRFPFDETSGTLIARSSRVIEPFLLDVVDALVPRTGAFRLLEVGCGSGVYIRRACERKPALTAVGLELQPQVAEFARENIEAWGLADRVRIEVSDVRAYAAGPEFDLVTLHQNIYYFPEEERVPLARQLGACLKPGGRLLLSSACRGGSPALQALNVWTSTTEGFGPLPDPDRLCAQLREAGFADVRGRKLIPFERFHTFSAKKRETAGSP